MEGKIWGKYVFTLFHGVEIGYHCSTVVLHHQHSVNAFAGVFIQLRIKNFCETDSYGLSWFCILFRNGDHRNTGNIFTHIIDVGTRALFCLAQSFFYVIGADYMNWLIIAGYQLIICKLFSGLDFRGSIPCRVIISSLSPALYSSLFCSVISFTLEKRCQTYRTIVVISPAAVISYYCVAGTICVVHYQFRHQCWLVSIVVVICTLEGGHTCPPAFAKDCSHCVFASLKVIGYIIGVVSKNGIILRGAWIKPFVWCNFLSINIEIIDTLCSQVKSCRLDLGFCFEASTDHRCSCVGRICISKNSCVTAVYGNCAAIYSHAVHSVKNGIGCASLCIQKGSSCIFSTILDLVICECGTVTCICCKTYGIQVRESISVFHGVYQDVISHLCSIYSNGQSTCSTENVNMMSFIFILVCDQAIQILVIFNGEKRSGWIVVFCIAHAVCVDLRAAVRANTGQIQFYADIVLAFLHFTVEHFIFQPEVISAKNERCGVTAFCYLNICGNIENSLRCSVKRKLSCSDPFGSIPGCSASVH